MKCLKYRIFTIFGFSFNLPRASAQLERLMGTNVVRLTDRKYMMELRKRIHEDFNEMLDKRIQNREVCKRHSIQLLVIIGFFFVLVQAANG